MSSLGALSVLLENVWLNNTINECVLFIADGKVTCKAMDLTGSIYVETSIASDIPDNTLALGNLGTFIKYLKVYTGIDATISRNDNRLTIKPKGGATLKFLLSDPDLIPTYDADWENEDRVAAVLENFESELILTNESISEVVQLMKMFGTKNAVFNVSAKGLVTVTGGNDSEHQFTGTLGKSTFKPCSIEIAASNLLSVLSVLDYTENPVIKLAADNPIVISCQGSTWVLNGIESQDTANE